MRYAISDVHGCAKTLAELVYKGINLKPEDSLYFLGDYIDRGRDSKTVLDLLMGWQEANICKELIILRGNHEELMLNGYDNNSLWNDIWSQNGMDFTMQSFPNKQVDEKYFNFMRDMPYVAKVDGFYLAHAGIEDIRHPMRSDQQVLLWDREITPRHHKVIVGHTPQTIPWMMETLNTNKIIIDGGCVYADPEIYGEGMGNLVALCLDTMCLIVQPNIEPQ